MNNTITIKFKDGKQITVEPQKIDFGLWFIGNEMYFNVIHGVLYRRRDNIICGKDITDTVDEVEISMKY